METPTRVECPKLTLTLTPAGTFTPRHVHYALPNTAPPPEGHPVAFMFQGSFFTSDLSFVGEQGQPIGLYYQAKTLAALLDSGYAVIAPEAKAGGTTFWDTNIPPFTVSWELSTDHLLMLAIFDAIDDGSFGPLDGSRLFATGISSGGYMTSRMAVSYPGRFRALAIHSGSYATCGGSLCLLPQTLPAAHPPTLFLHGSLDAVVPQSTMEPYEQRLASEVGSATRKVIDPGAGHEWIASAPQEVVSWFETYRQD